MVIRGLSATNAGKDAGLRDDQRLSVPSGFLGAGAAVEGEEAFLGFTPNASSAIRFKLWDSARTASWVSCNAPSEAVEKRESEHYLRELHRGRRSLEERLLFEPK